MKKMKKWIYPRHGIIRDILYWPFRIFAYLVYGAVVENMGIKRTSQSLIVMNHQTAFDQFFISISFRQPIYFIASEDLFSNGFI
ncbi:MAG: hypothetical protein GX633_04345, partial [Clostridiales bacterium]|nr:hypothetical protein [Clostridiales bacterium]